MTHIDTSCLMLRTQVHLRDSQARFALLRNDENQGIGLVLEHEGRPHLITASSWVLGCTEVGVALFGKEGPGDMIFAEVGLKDDLHGLAELRVKDLSAAYIAPIAYVGDLSPTEDCVYIGLTTNAHGSTLGMCTLGASTRIRTPGGSMAGFMVHTDRFDTLPCGTILTNGSAIWGIVTSIFEPPGLWSPRPATCESPVGIALATGLTCGPQPLRDFLDCVQATEQRTLYRKFEPRDVQMTRQAFASLPDAWARLCPNEPADSAWFGPFCIDSDGDLCAGWAHEHRTPLEGVDPQWAAEILEDAPQGGSFFLAGREVHLYRKRYKGYIVPFTCGVETEESP